MNAHPDPCWKCSIGVFLQTLHQYRLAVLWARIIDRKARAAS